jgi:hypothetical protein
MSFTMGQLMNLYERNTCSFIVKVWVEGNDDDAGVALWRGHITHVLSGKRQYFEDLTTIYSFITPYLEEIGVAIDQSAYGQGNAG